MATQRFDLSVEKRKVGKHWARTLRNEKKVPAVIYGAVKENMFVIIDENTILKYQSKAYENALFNIKFDGQELVTMIKDIQKHPVTHRPEHVDLLAIDLNKPIRLAIEIRIEGKPVGLAEGGLLTIVNRSVEIECIPTQIPEGIVVDVSHLGIGDSLHVSDLKIPENVKLISSPDMTIAVVNVQEEEKVETATATSGETGAATTSATSTSATTSASAKDATSKEAGKEPKKKS